MVYCTDTEMSFNTLYRYNKQKITTDGQILLLPSALRLTVFKHYHKRQRTPYYKKQESRLKQQCSKHLISSSRLQTVAKWLFRPFSTYLSYNAIILEIAAIIFEISENIGFEPITNALTGHCSTE